MKKTLKVFLVFLTVFTLIVFFSRDTITIPAFEITVVDAKTKNKILDGCLDVDWSPFFGDILTLKNENGVFKVPKRNFYRYFGILGGVNLGVGFHFLHNYYGEVNKRFWLTKFPKDYKKRKLISYEIVKGKPEQFDNLVQYKDHPIKIEWEIEKQKSLIELYKAH